MRTRSPLDGRRWTVEVLTNHQAARLLQAICFCSGRGLIAVPALIRHVPLPEPGPGLVCIKVEAFGLN